MYEIKALWAKYFKSMLSDTNDWRLDFIVKAFLGLAYYF